ncbi:NAD-dependent deacetylase hst3 [Savitreella phatthalungensis]
MLTFALSPSVHENAEAVNAAQAVLRAKRVIVLTGAGISCSAGIPDFRSLHGFRKAEVSQKAHEPPPSPPATPRRRSARVASTQLSSELEFCSQSSVSSTSSETSDTTNSRKRKRSASPPIIKGAELFDVSLFKAEHTTRAFYQFMNRMRNEAVLAKPTAMHKLMRTLRDNGKLVRCYTQNIDGLEREAGLSTNTLDGVKGNDALQLHGDLHTLRCDRCAERVSYESDLHDETMSQGEAPECPRCAEQCALRIALGKRNVAVGLLRPDVVLYGEAHPSADIISKAVGADLRRRPDCVLVCGTSLKIPGFKALVKQFAAQAKASKKGGAVIFVNMEAPAVEWKTVFDAHFQGPTDSFCDLLQRTRPAFFKEQTTLDFPEIKPHLSLAHEQILIERPASPPGTPRKRGKPNSSNVPVRAKSKCSAQVEEQDGKENVAPLLQV